MYIPSTVSLNLSLSEQFLSSFTLKWNLPSLLGLKVETIVHWLSWRKITTWCVLFATYFQRQESWTLHWRKTILTDGALLGKHDHMKSRWIKAAQELQAHLTVEEFQCWWLWCIRRLCVPSSRRRALALATIVKEPKAQWLPCPEQLGDGFLEVDLWVSNCWPRSLSKQYDAFSHVSL